MKYFSFVKFDFIYGILKNYKKFLLFAALILLACLELGAAVNNADIKEFSYGDCLLYIYGGMAEYIPDPSIPFQIPYLWLLNHIVLLYFTLHYMYSDLTGFGQSMIYRSGSRSAWWFSKCTWNLLIIALFYALAWLLILAFALSRGAVLSLENSSAATQLMYFGPKQIPKEKLDLAVEITLLPLLTSAAISLMQMMLCLIIKPIMSYIISNVVLISSAYYLSPMLIGNYSMALRSDNAVTNGVSEYMGILYAIMLAALSIGIGLCIFRRCNILDSKE